MIRDERKDALAELLYKVLRAANRLRRMRALLKTGVPARTRRILVDLSLA